VRAAITLFAVVAKSILKSGYALVLSINSFSAAY
jgi:hypothetical protein